VLLNGNQRSYTGINGAKERIDVGPDVTYRYLHVKMYRDQDIGGFGATLLARTDITQAQIGLTAVPFSSKMTDGTWDDYSFDLKSISSTNKTFYGFYFAVNSTSGNPTMATTTYIDDVYLSNDPTPITSNIYTVNVTVLANNNTMGTVSPSGVYIKGTPSSIIATPNQGYQFVKWSNGASDLSTSASYTFTPTTDMTLTANFALASGINDLFESSILKVEGHNLIFKTEECVANVYNITGKLVASQKVADSILKLDQTGIYLIKLLTSQGVKIQKILIQ